MFGKVKRFNRKFVSWFNFNREDSCTVFENKVDKCIGKTVTTLFNIYKGCLPSSNRLTGKVGYNVNVNKVKLVINIGMLLNYVNSCKNSCKQG